MNTVRSPAPGKNFFNIPMVNIPKQNNIVLDTAGNFVNAANSAAMDVMNTAKDIVGGGFSVVNIILILLFLVVLVCVAIFWRQIQEGFSRLYDRVREVLGLPTTMHVETGEGEVTEVPEAPQDDTTKESHLVEKILPGKKEVFNISKNAYTYYDAEPLCKALGAELATYEQVKEAYGGGADWCNYGWSKGQMAVYPTQQGTWEEIQNGPEEQRNACGRPGINGGFFDNPELRFGVNCYGIKPAQKEHDATVITSGSSAPLSPAALEFEKKVNKYRGDANSIGILPFNRAHWSS